MTIYFKKVILITILSFARFVLAQHNINDQKQALNNIGHSKIINYNSKNYKSNPRFYDAIQDNYGIMYFGNLWGIIQFDGIKWNKIPLSNGSSCTSLAIDKNGIIYVGGRNEIGYLKQNTTGEKQFISLRHKVNGIKSFGEVWQTYATKDGIIFASQEALLFKPYDKEEVKVLLKNLQNCFYVNNQIIVQKDNKLWLYYRNRFTTLSGSNTMTEITSIIAYKKDLLCATSQGLYIYDGNSFSEWNLHLKAIFNQGFSRIAKTSDNRLIFSVKQNGIIITDIHGNILSSLNKSSGLITNSISGIYLDKEENLWLNSNSGISYVPLSDEISFINDFLGITGTPYSSALYDDYMYLSTSDGLFRKKISSNINNIRQQFEKVNGINGVVWNLFVYDDKLFCGQANAAYIIDGQEVKKIHNQGTWLFHPIEGLNLMLIGTYKGLAILEKKNQSWIYRNAIKGFEESSRYLVEDKYGDIWVSHGNKGVYQIRINKALTQVTKIKHFNKSNGLPKNYDNNVFKVNNQLLISGNKGIYYFDYETEKIKKHIPLSKILGTNVHIERIQQISESLFWIMFNNGSLAKVETYNKDKFKIKLLTNRFQNNTIESFEHFNQITDNLLMVGTQEGFSLLKKDKLLDNANLNFNSYINKVEIITNKPQILWNGLSSNLKALKDPIAYNQKSLRFSFTATSYKDLQALHFQYFLEGFEDDTKWSNWTSNSFKEYTNLREGHYIFHVRAVNSSGVISTPTSLAFYILPPWYRTWYAYLIYIILLFAITKTAIKYLKRWLDKEKKKIELEKERKIREQQLEWEEARIKNDKIFVKLQQEKLEIEALNLSKKEELLNVKKEKEREIFEMQQEKLQADITSKNNELTSLTIHITQKNEVLSKIKTSLNKAIKESEETNTRNHLSQIEQLIEKNLNSHKEWEKFSEHFDVVHEDFLKKLQKKYPDLKANSLKLCAYIKMKLSSKQIAVLMNTEPESVIKARYRLRIKFNLTKEVSLEEFLNHISFDNASNQN